MIAEEWGASSDSAAMLESLLQRSEAHRVGRKLRLFACGCVRQRGLSSFSDARFRAAVEAAERYADGEATPEELLAARGDADAAMAMRSYYMPNRLVPLAVLARETTYGSASEAARQAPGVEASDGPLAQALLLRCIFGNPFRPVHFDPAWRTPEVVALATAAYEERVLPSGELDPQRLSVLADALEEVGAWEEIAMHLRSTGPHVRGCWVLDLCLGKT